MSTLRSHSTLALKRGQARRRKPSVNARPPAARQRPKPGPRLRHRRRLRVGNSDGPATATCRRHLLCGNPSTWPDNPTASVRTSKWTMSIIPPGAFQRMQTRPRARTHAPYDRRHRPSAYIQNATTGCLLNAFPFDDRY